MRYLIAFFLFCGSTLAQTANVTLTWTASPTPVAQVSKYTIYRSPISGQYPTTSWVGNSGSATALTFINSIPLTAAPQTFFYVVRTLGIDGKTESVNSNEVKTTIPALPPPIPIPPKVTCNITITGATVTGTCQ